MAMRLIGGTVLAVVVLVACGGGSARAQVVSCDMAQPQIRFSVKEERSLGRTESVLIILRVGTSLGGADPGAVVRIKDSKEEHTILNRQCLVLFVPSELMIRSAEPDKFTHVSIQILPAR